MCEANEKKEDGASLAARHAGSGPQAPISANSGQAPTHEVVLPNGVIGHVFPAFFADDASPVVKTGYAIGSRKPPRRRVKASFRAFWPKPPTGVERWRWRRERDALIPDEGYSARPLIGVILFGPHRGGPYCDRGGEQGTTKYTNHTKEKTRRMTEI